MIQIFKNPSQLMLQITALTFEGAPKLDVASGTVRVFTVVGGLEVDALATTALSLIVGSSVWRYVWGAPPLASAGHYIIEYRLIDSEAVLGVATEDLLVEDDLVEDATVIAKLNALDAKVDTVLDSELGEEILNPNDQTWTKKRRDSTILKVFDVVDDNNNPNGQDVFRRIPRP